MYSVIFVLLLLLSLFLIGWSFTKQKYALSILGFVLGVCTLLLFPFLNFYGELLWFHSVGYADRFWTVLFSQFGFLILFAVLSSLFVFGLTWFIPSRNKFQRILSLGFAAFLGASWGFSNWDTILFYMNSVRTETLDPILNQQTGFYLFHLPFYNHLYALLLLLTGVALLVSILSMGFRFQQNEVVVIDANYESPADNKSSHSFYLSAALLFVILAWGKFLDRYHLLYSQSGVVSGAGWTDVHIRLPAYWVMIVLFLISAGIVLVPFLRNFIQHKIFSSIQNYSTTQESVFVPLYSFGSLAVICSVIWLITLNLLPGAFQWLYVEPNEISVESPYIKNNIEFTRKGFQLDKVEERQFPVSNTFNQQLVNQNKNLFDNIRLWDYRALDSVYQQFQEIRLYYEFKDVDIDRYTIDGKYREVMVSAREMNQHNLPEQSKTFVNRVFKYTHGFGITLNTVSEFTPQGLPNLLIKDIPPKSTYEELKVEQPRIYYGESTDSYVVVNSGEEEFDYPSGDTNIYNRYDGSGGVPLSNIFRKFMYGSKFGGTRFFFSNYPTKESRILFHRHIHERAQMVAPFLTFDDDPYIALVNGQLYWIMDGYTKSNFYPYSEPFQSHETIEYRNQRHTRRLTSLVDTDLHGVNYIRNSVKVVINAYNGDMSFYVYEPDDPLIQVWQNIFPDLFKSKQDMPRAFQEHVRYPADFLLIQGLLFAKYHMQDPTVFYNQEDLWVRATEKYYNQVRPVEPYYIMWEPPNSDKMEFVLILPFTPKNRQVMIGWIAGMCDPENYGRFLAYQFPKEKRILGPQQVETKIDQDSFLSGQLTLWDQRGSNVIRGNVLAIPIEKTLLYVEPIYLQAETAAYP
ncbi:UPF0182 family protein, partial [bacterium]|nr:UPF0182 family protein [bacterium]